LRIPGRLSIFACLVCVGTGSAEQALISGILYGDSLFAAQSPLDAGPRIWRSEIDIYGQNDPSPVRYGTSDPGRDGCFRATLFRDQLWTVVPGANTFQIIPLDDLQYFEHNDFVRKLREIRFGKPKEGTRSWDSQFSQSTWDILIGFLDRELPYYLGDLLDRHERPRDMWFKSQWFVQNHRYDILPVDQSTLHVFNLNIDRIVIEPAHRKGEARGEFRVEPLKVRNAVKSNNTFAVPFRGDFHVYESGSAYFFLTDNGLLYRAKSKGKDPKDGWDVSAVWGDKNKPLLGVMHDVKAGKYFAFGTANKRDAGTKSDTGERFYFELAEKPTFVEYKRTSKAPKPVLEGFHEAYACARMIAIRNAKK